MEEAGAEHLCSRVAFSFILQEKVETTTDTCADFPVQPKPLNPSHTLQIPHQGLAAFS